MSRQSAQPPAAAEPRDSDAGHVAKHRPPSPAAIIGCRRQPSTGDELARLTITNIVRADMPEYQLQAATSASLPAF